MKKLLAVLLAAICAFSAISVSAVNTDELGNIIGDHLGITTEEDEADILSYGIHYEMAMLSTVTLLYKPSASITFNAPTDMVVTNDYPIAVDHNWVCWKDQATGELYYPGDTIHVDGKVTLIAVWEEKTDNYPGFIRSAIAGVQALIKLIEKFMGVFELVNSTAPSEEATTEPTTSEIYVIV
ncbi:MAG: hypothetical protein E7538_06140 [Ruminococcaceae bacterium]|nr:hypothetical protein [Oscillospiraceae bacterium]